MVLSGKVCALVHHSAQLIRGQTLGGGFGGRHDGAHQEVGDRVDEPYKRVQRPQQWVEDVHGGERDPFGQMRGDCLRCDFREDQKEQRQHDGCNHDCGIAEVAQPNDGTDARGHEVDQVVADEDDTQQAVGPAQQPRGLACAAMAFFYEMHKPVAIERHHGGFGAREVGREYGEHRQGRKQPCGGDLIEAHGRCRVIPHAPG